MEQLQYQIQRWLQIKMKQAPQVRTLSVQIPKILIYILHKNTFDAYRKWTSYPNG